MQKANCRQSGPMLNIAACVRSVLLYMLGAEVTKHTCCPCMRARGLGANIEWRCFRSMQTCEQVLFSSWLRSWKPKQKVTRAPIPKISIDKDSSPKNVGLTWSCRCRNWLYRRSTKKGAESVDCAAAPSSFVAPLSTFCCWKKTFTRYNCRWASLGEQPPTKDL